MFLGNDSDTHSFIFFVWKSEKMKENKPERNLIDVSDDDSADDSEEVSDSDEEELNKEITLQLSAQQVHRVLKEIYRVLKL